jgi:hypothetical protein
MTGCASLHMWTVRTSSTPFPSSSDLASIGKESVALLPPLTTPGLRENEAGLGRYLGEAIKKTFPTWKIIEEQQTISLINSYGLVGEYTRLRKGAEQSHILDQELLQKIGKRIGVRYVFQPRLAYISQTMTNRWTIPLINIRFMETRTAHMRLSLQLWDTVSGELIWSSVAETAMEDEAFNQDPVFIEDVSRVTFDSMLKDFQNRKTSSTYIRSGQLIDTSGSE